MNHIAIDVGNTNTCFGIFSEGKLISVHRFSTHKYDTLDEWKIIIENILKEKGGEFTASLGSVVPSKDENLIKALKCLNISDILKIKPGVKTGVPILYEYPSEVGVDRIVNAVALKEKYGCPGIVVDFGTAITFDVVSEKGEYLGGLICPGISMSLENLFKKTSLLPLVDFKKPPSVIGKNTIHSIQSGIYYGFLGLIEGILQKIIKEKGPFNHIVATGGYSEIISKDIPLITAVEVELTLWGLYFIFLKNV
ncbi:MAG: type III pantothenate kinase [Thermoanaerobaculia bacterium]